MMKPEWNADTRAAARDAAWYAWGANDTVLRMERLVHATMDSWRVDVHRFSEHYGDLVHSGRSRPSVQDAYTQWRENNANV
jgi:hypothetical protein